MSDFGSGSLKMSSKPLNSPERWKCLSYIKVPMQLIYGYDKKVTHYPRRFRVWGHVILVSLSKERCERLNSSISIYDRYTIKAQ